MQYMPYNQFIKMNAKRIITIGVSLGTAAFVTYQLWKSRKRKLLSKPDLEKQLLTFRSEQSCEIVIVSTEEEWAAVYPILAEKIRDIQALGFDCEWVMAGIRSPVALIQLATYDGFCVLVRVFLLESIPQTLKQLLYDRSVLKLGVGCWEDGQKLWKDYRMRVLGCVDLRDVITRTPGYKNYNHSMSLAGLAKNVLDVEMKKDKKTRCGHWEAETLSDKQIDYAADDALMGVDIFMQLLVFKVLDKSQCSRCSSSYYGSSIRVNMDDFWSKARSMCQGIVDVKCKVSATNVRTFDRIKRTLSVGSSEDEDGTSEHSAVAQSSSVSKPVKVSKKAFMTRKRPLYYNCQLLAPDGQCLTLCDIRKAEWYISKGLGEKVSDDPLSVKLKFEPKARPTSRKDYYLQDKNNVCVVCGADEEYVRKLVVPQEYRRYFPAILKDHSSHDVLLLCISCHLQCANYEMALRQQLVVECDAPLDSGKDCMRRLDQDLAKVMSAAKALQKSRDRIPAARIEELENTVKTFYGIQHMTTIPDQLLQEAVAMETKVKNELFEPHGKKVVEHYMQKDGGLLKFEQMWRKQFVECMEPKHLPDLWSIEHNPERLKKTDFVLEMNGITSDDYDVDDDDCEDGYTVM